MKKRFTSLVLALVFGIAGFLTIMPVNTANAAGYGYICGNANSPVLWLSSGSLYTYRLAGTNYFCSVTINPYWGSQRYLQLVVQRPDGVIQYDVGAYYYYAGPITYIMNYGQCASLTGTVANVNMTNKVTTVMSVCNR